MNKFKKGDRVRSLVNDGRYYEGDEGVVEKYTARDVLMIHWDKRCPYGRREADVREHQIELIEENKTTEIETLELDLEQLQERLTATQERLEELKKAKKRDQKLGDVYRLETGELAIPINHGWVHMGRGYYLNEASGKVGSEFWEEKCEYIGNLNNGLYTREQLKEKFAKMEDQHRDSGEHCQESFSTFEIGDPANFIDNLLDGKNDDGSNVEE